MTSSKNFYITETNYVLIMVKCIGRKGAFSIVLLFLALTVAVERYEGSVNTLTSVFNVRLSVDTVTEVRGGGADSQYFHQRFEIWTVQSEAIDQLPFLTALGWR